MSRILIRDRGHESDFGRDSDVRCGDAGPASSSVDDKFAQQRGRSVAFTPCTASRPEEALRRVAAGLTTFVDRIIVATPIATLKTTGTSSIGGVDPRWLRGRHLKESKLSRHVMVSSLP